MACTIVQPAFVIQLISIALCISFTGALSSFTTLNTQLSPFDQHLNVANGTFILQAWTNATSTWEYVKNPFTMA